MRDFFERLECDILAEYAVKSQYSKGRQYQEPLSSTRTCFQRDRDRIIHSKAFRRLKHKTQVFIASESDHYRSRLTHTLEVSQISRHIARLLRLNEDLAEAIALAHDLGHTPFGHSGERELNALMKAFGGFEHNIQSLRVVDELEVKYPQFKGLNLSSEVRSGLLKHESFDVIKELDFSVTLESQVVNIADEIAYNNHDLDDGLSSGILKEASLSTNISLWQEAKSHVGQQHSTLSGAQLKTLINSYIISFQIEDVIKTTMGRLNENKICSLADVKNYSGHIVGFSAKMEAQNKCLRKYLFDHFYFYHTIYRMNKKGQRVIRALFNAFLDDLRLLPEAYQLKIKQGYEKERVVCDYIAGMTDFFAQKEYNALF